MSNDLQAPKKARDRAKARYDGRCGYCGQEGPLVTDHMTPVIQDGTHDDENLMPACTACNMFKRGMTVNQYRMYLRTIPKQLTESGDQWRLLRQRFTSADGGAIDRHISFRVAQCQALSIEIEKLMIDRKITFYFERITTDGV